MSALVVAFSEWNAPSTSAQGAKRYEGLAQALHVVRTYLYPRDLSGSSLGVRPVETVEVKDAFRVVLREGRGDEVLGDFMDDMEKRFPLVRRDIARYMSRLQETSAVSVLPQTDTIMAEMLEKLSIWQRVWGMTLRSFNDTKLIQVFTTAFHQLLHASLPATFPIYLQLFLSSSLAQLPQHLSNPPAAEGLLQAVPINLQRVPPPSPHLSRLRIFPRYSATLSRVAYDEIEKIAREEAAKGWEGRRLTRARQRVGEGVANWLSGMFDESAQATLRPMFSRFDYYLCKCFFDIRTEELFDMIVDYPDSMAALEDLKECLFKVDQRSQLVDKLKAANIKRLLHPGAETKDVITQYISTIRCLRILDPPGVLLHKIADPIRRHLRDRQDTIRCIVATLVEGEELQDENEAMTGSISQSNDETVENFLDPKWDPEPVDAAPEFRSGKASDIISTLVSIYETREVIIKELQVLLATRLLAVKDYDAVREIRTIELLKIRFGETALQVCDVMIKDMADSKRIDDHVHGDIKSIVHPLVISRMFWPNIQTSSLKLPSKLESIQRDYEAAFHHFKPDKRLRWLQHIGTANVKLELSDRTVEVEATPLQASVAALLEEQAVWKTEKVAERLEIGDLAIVRNALAFWANLGVVKEESTGWRLLEYAEESKASTTTAVLDEAPMLESAADVTPDRLRIHWQFIEGCLKNLGPKTIKEIQSTLTTFVDEYDQSLEDLEAFMSAVRREGLVDLREDGHWILLTA